MVDSAEREWLLQKHVEEAVTRVHQIAFADDLTPAESKLIWIQVIAKLIESVMIDRQSEVTSQWMGLKDAASDRDV
jgi:hypothetical protein